MQIDIHMEKRGVKKLLRLHVFYALGTFLYGIYRQIPKPYVMLTIQFLMFLGSFSFVYDNTERKSYVHTQKVTVFYIHIVLYT